MEAIPYSIDKGTTVELGMMILSLLERARSNGFSRSCMALNMGLWSELAGGCGLFAPDETKDS